MKKSFRERVYKFTKSIPKGKVATYGQIAAMAGNPLASRAVGVFMKLNSDVPNTPCHRVVASSGELTGYSGTGGIRAKKAMLIAEGVTFIGNKVNLSKSQLEKKN